MKSKKKTKDVHFWDEISSTDSSKQLDALMLKHFMESFHRDEEVKKANPQNYCRLCGEYKTKTASLFTYSPVPQLCEKCYEKMAEDMIRLLLPKSKLSCSKCFSHVNACMCPERTALTNLKK